MANDDETPEETPDESLEPGEAPLPAANEVSEQAAAEDIQPQQDFDARQERISERRRYFGPIGPERAAGEALPMDSTPETDVEEPDESQPNEEG